MKRSEEARGDYPAGETERSTDSIIHRRSTGTRIVTVK